MDSYSNFSRSAEYLSKGSFIKLLDLKDNYTKKTEFINATLIATKTELFILNNEYDLDQDQINYISFPLNADAQLIHYTISEEEEKTECVKWVNLNLASLCDAFYGFEFESYQKFIDFAVVVSKYVQIDEEGFQNPLNRIENLSQMQSLFSITFNTISSHIIKYQINPEYTQEEAKLINSGLNLKRIKIQNLSHLYASNSILFIAFADLFLIDSKASLLIDRGIYFLLVKHQNCQISLDLVRGRQIVMRIIINSKFCVKIIKEKKCVIWIEKINNVERRTWKAILNDDIQYLENLINVVKDPNEIKLYNSIFQKNRKTELENEDSITEDENEVDYEDVMMKNTQDDNTEIYNNAQKLRLFK